MKNKKRFVFVPLVLLTVFAMGACGTHKDSSSVSLESISESSDSTDISSSSESSSESSEESSEPIIEHTVRFFIEGELVQTSTVVHNELAVFVGIELLICCDQIDNLLGSLAEKASKDRAHTTIIIP